MPNAPGTLEKPHWLQGNDLTGTVCGHLTVERQVERPADSKVKIRGTWWLCRCQCGKEKILPRQYIIQQTVHSCGCRKTPVPKISKPDPKKPRPTTTKERLRYKPPGLQINFETLAKSMVCDQCGKTFDRLCEQWAYKANIKGKMRWYCTWKCLRKATKDLPPSAEDW